MIATDLTADDAAERAHLLDRAAWLIRLRGLALAWVVLMVVAGRVSGFVQDPGHILAVGGALGLGNLVWWRRLRRTPATIPVAGIRLGVLQQLLADMFALALILHFSGGAENPFVVMFAFPAAIGAMLLPSRQAIALGALGGAAYVTVVLGQLTGVLPHHGLHGATAQHRIVDELYRSPRFVAAYLLAFVLLLGGVIYLVRSLAERARRAEASRREHERVAESRERLARIGELSAGVAHSVRNPLHALLKCVELLRDRPGADPRSESGETLALMTEALGRIEGVTRRLLSLAREAPLQPLPCDLDMLVLDTVKIVTSSRDVRARVTTELGGLGKVEIDAHRFAEALNNVLDNALHACRDGGTITVRTRDEAGEGGVAVEVIDSGEGIAEQHLARVFDPFFTTKAVGEGTGLGLAVTRRIVEEHGGGVTLESEHGRGTRVRLIVPRRERTGAGGAG